MFLPKNIKEHKIVESRIKMTFTVYWLIIGFRRIHNSSGQNEEIFSKASHFPLVCQARTCIARLYQPLCQINSLWFSTCILMVLKRQTTFFFINSKKQLFNQIGFLLFQKFVFYAEKVLTCRRQNPDKQSNGKCCHTYRSQG